VGLLRHSAATLAAALGLPALGAIAALRPAWRRGLSERLGRGSATASGGAWVHAASVGEVSAAVRLLDLLVDAGHPVLASVTTPTGRDVLGRLRPQVAARFAPVDHPWCVEAALAQVKPRALVLVESELWPNWIAAAARRGVRVGVVSAHVSDRSFSRYRRLASILGGTWGRLTAVGARSELDAERFVALGVAPERVSITGDLKLDVPGDMPPLAAELTRYLHQCAAMVGASTHAGEEIALLGALRSALDAGLAACLVLAPRHLARLHEVERTVQRFGFPLVRRTNLARTPADDLPPAAGSVLLIDTLGELPGLLPLARVVFVGGTLAPIGGHNLVEPAWAGRPVLFGTHTGSVKEAAELLLASGGAARIRNPDELGREVTALLADAGEADRRGGEARAALGPHRGAARRCADLVETLLAECRA